MGIVTMVIDQETLYAVDVAEGRVYQVIAASGECQEEREIRLDPMRYRYFSDPEASKKATARILKIATTGSS